MLKRFLQVFGKSYRSPLSKLALRTPAQTTRRLFLLRYFSWLKIWRYSKVLSLMYIVLFIIYFLLNLGVDTLPENTWLYSISKYLLTGWIAFISFSALIHYNDIMQIVLATNPESFIEYLGLVVGYIGAIGFTLPYDLFVRLVTDFSHIGDALLIKEIKT